MVCRSSPLSALALQSPAKEGSAKKAGKGSKKRATPDSNDGSATKKSRRGKKEAEPGSEKKKKAPVSGASRVMCSDHPQHLRQLRLLFATPRDPECILCTCRPPTTCS